MLLTICHETKSSYWQNGPAYLNSETVHQLHGPVAERHIHVDGPVLSRKGSLHLQALAL